MEEMAAFFDRRVAEYDEHMRTEVDGGDELYAQTAACFAPMEGLRLLDLGCGTGLELEPLFARIPSMKVTGIDLSEGMTNALLQKFPDREVVIRLEDYLTCPLGEGCFDAAVSVESLHHFTGEQKTALYQKLFRALTPDGYFVECDYFAPDEAYEKACREEYERNLLQETDASRYYHLDTPHTLEHEIEWLRRGGFTDIQVLWQKGWTILLKAKK